jgi:hypothetical protein
MEKTTAGQARSRHPDASTRSTLRRKSERDEIQFSFAEIHKRNRKESERFDFSNWQTWLIAENPLRDFTYLYRISQGNM